jgi:predicted permease
MLKRVRQWLRAIFRRRTLDREMREEMQRHLDLTAKRLVERGMSPGEARWAARREFGNLAFLEEQARDARGATWVESVRSDMRYALRALRPSPAFATVAILSLAIGIGANTAIFSLIDAVMLKSLPVQRPGELVLAAMRDSNDATSALGKAFFTNPMWEQIRDQTRSFAGYAVSGSAGFNLASGGEVRPATGMWVNGDYFRTLGVRPAIGRLFALADDWHGCPPTAVLSYGFWQSEFGGRADVVGKSITLTGQPFTIVGVTAPGFFGVDVGFATQVYAPLCSEVIVRGKSSALDRRTTWWLRIIARPKGLSANQFAARLMDASRGVFEGSVPERYDAKNRANFLAMRLVSGPGGNGLSSVRKEYSKALLALMAMVAIILLISCANVANLLLARGAARGREIAIRIAIGASRVRLVRQLVTESVLLAFAGSGLGLIIANWASRFLVSMLGATTGHRIALDLSLDLRVMTFTAAVSVATVMLFGLTPAWRATRVDPQSAMKAGGRGNIDGHTRFRIGKALVVAQSALALVLVIGAGLLVSTFHRLNAANPGFRSDGVIIADLDLRGSSIPPQQYLGANQRLLAQFRTLPGVRSASMAQQTPVSGSTWNEEVIVDGFQPLNEDDRLSWFNQVSDGYFTTMGTRLLAGRDFGRDDTPRSTRVAIVNAAMVRHFFHGASPIGKVYMTEDNGKRSPPITIVGVVENTRYKSLRDTVESIIYLATDQDSLPFSGSTFILSVSASPTAITSAVKAIAAGADPRISLRFQMLSDQLAKSLQREKVLAVLSGLFGSLALILAMIGLYGVMAYTVARRRVEIGIRIALGAAQSRVVRLVLGDVGRLIALGIVIGGIGAIAATRLLGAFLFGVEARDPITIVTAALVLALAALIAGAIPASRAARLEPVEALRED